VYCDRYGAVYAYFYVCVYVYLYTHVHIYLHVYMYISTHIYIYTSTYTYIDIYVYLYMYIYMCRGKTDSGKLVVHGAEPVPGAVCACTRAWVFSVCTPAFFCPVDTRH